MRSEDVKARFEAALAQASAAAGSKEGGRAAAALLTSEADETIAALVRNASAETGRDTSGYAFVAVGGYGRAELAPQSDLDILVLHRGRSQEDVTEFNKHVLYPLWDSGRRIAHRVRTLSDALRILNETDEAAATLDARLIAGDARLFRELQSGVFDRLRKSRASFFRDLTRENAARHEASGHAGHLIEPDVRDSAGGLRDIHTLRWAAQLTQGAGDLDALVTLGFLGPEDRDVIEHAAEFLFAVRVRLHLVTGRHQDKLFLAQQDAVARGMGYADVPGRGPADGLMRDVYLVARDVDAIVASTWERLLHVSGRLLGGAFRRFRSAPPTAGAGWVVRDGRFDVVAVTPPFDDPAGWLRMFAQTLEAGVPMARTSVNRLRALLHSGQAVGWTPAARGEFVGIMRAGRDGARLMQTIDDSGLLAAMVPEWADVRCRPQRNPYHRWTVDVHLFETVADLVESRRSEEPDVQDAWIRVSDDERLLVAALLHDVGKIRTGDHAVTGAALARDVCTRMGMDEDSVDDVEFLVRCHLVLAETATRRDLNDERTAMDVAVRTGTPQRLAMLYLLTRADAKATGPEASSTWRTSLVRELYAKAMRELETGRDGFADADAKAATRRAQLASSTGWPVDVVDDLVDLLGVGWLLGTDADAAARQLVLMRTPPGRDEVRIGVHDADEWQELVLVAADRQGLFAIVTGVLAMRGVEVLAADVHTRADGVALEALNVATAHGRLDEARWESIRRDIERGLQGEVDLEATLHRAPAPVPADALEIATRVVVDNDASDFYTVVEVHTADRPGVLRSITRALADEGCDLRLAKVATYGAEVVDVFYLRDVLGQKITGADELRRVERAVLDRLGL